MKVINWHTSGQREGLIASEDSGGGPGFEGQPCLSSGAHHVEESRCGRSRLTKFTSITLMGQGGNNPIPCEWFSRPQSWREATPL